MKTREYKSIPIVENWLLKIGASNNTEIAYLQSLKAYCELLNKTPNELILEAEADVRAGLLMRERRIEGYLLKYKKYLQDKCLAPLTIKTRMTGVMSFYNYNYIELPILPKSTKAKPLERNLTIPTREQIQEVLNYCDRLEKALILVGVSSGLAEAEIRNLKVKDFVGHQDEKNVTTLALRRTKSQFDFITFLNPEATSAVQDYLDFRNSEPCINEPHYIEHLQKQKVYSLDNYLFIHRYVSDDFLKTKDDKSRSLKDGTLEHIYNYISVKAQKSSPKGDYNLIRSHNMRRYFGSALKNAGCDNFHVEFWMGHTLDATQAAYFRADPEKQKKLYLQYMDYLVIQKELNITESPEFLRIKADNEVLMRETARHVVERSELQDLRAELEAEKTGKDAHDKELIERARKETITEFLEMMENPVEAFKQSIRDRREAESSKTK